MQRHKYIQKNMQIIRNLISRLTMLKSGKAIYDPIKKELLYYWTDCYFDEYVAKNRFRKRIKIN